MVRWSAGLLFTDYWSFSVSELICIPEKSGWSFLATNLHVSKCAPLYSVSCLQSNFPTQGVQIKIQILALFFNQRYESGPQAVISTCSQVVSIILSGELSNSNDTLPLCSAEGTKVAFQVYLLLENVSGPEKDQVLLQAKESLSSLSTYSSC